MIILDTNVASEPMKENGDPTVKAWLDKQVPSTLYLTSVSLGELLCGIATVPEGRRKQGLVVGLGRLRIRIRNAVLPYDEAAAMAYAEAVLRAKANLYTLPVADGQIAAIAIVHGFTVATRDVDPFLAAGVNVINPWTDE
jgi:predicted nucleic acid-binding protein